MIPTLPITRPQSPWRRLRLLSCVRMDEVCVLQGAPLMGAMFSAATLTSHDLLLLAAVMSGSLCLVAHVFVLNDWAGIHGDLRDPSRASRTFMAKGVSRAALGHLALALLILALVLFWLVNAATAALGVAIAGASALYSGPGLHVKGRPVFSSILHLAGGGMHFLLGYAALSPIDTRGVVIACFFALVFTAGHLTHEALDHEGDALNGIRTNAVTFGKRPTFVAGLVLFTAAYALLAALAALGVIPRILVLAPVLYPLHLWMSLRALRIGLTRQSLRRLQTCYRLLYAVLGATMVVASVPSMI